MLAYIFFPVQWKYVIYKKNPAHTGWIFKYSSPAFSIALIDMGGV